jgi:hypothetical protein
MYKKIVSQGSFDGLITLPEVKAHCRVFNDFENSYLSSLIPVCLDLCQSYTGRMLTTGTAVVVVDGGCREVLLPYGEVTSITTLLLDGVESDAYSFDDVTQKVTITVPYDNARIEFVAGYSTLPLVVKHAALILASTQYNIREDVIVGQAVNEIPRTSRDLLDRVKLPWQ